MKHKAIWLVLPLSLAALILTASCSGGDGGGSSPTAPPAPQAPRYILQGAVFLQNSNFQSTLQEMDFFLDGEKIGTVTSNPADSQLTGVLSNIGISPGTHTVSLRIIRQTVHEANYWTPGSRVFITDLQNGNRVLDESLQIFRAPRREGQGFEWSFRF